MFFKSSTSSMFKDISLPAIFIDMYVPIADGTQLKVYLFGYKSAFFYNGKEPQDLDDVQIANAIGVSKEEVENAWHFWESMELVKIHQNGDTKEIEFLDIYSSLIDKINGEGGDLSGDNDSNETDNTIIDDAEKAESIENNELYSDSDFFYEISKSEGKNSLEIIEDLLGRPLTPKFRLELLEKLEAYDMDNELSVIAMKKALKESASNPQTYALKIIDNWHDSGFTNAKHIIESDQEHSERNSIYRAVMKNIGQNRMASKYETKIIDTWIDEYHMDLEMIDAACERSINISNPNVPYINGVIKNWYQAGIDTLEKIAENEGERHKKSKGTTYNHSTGKTNTAMKNANKTKFHNFNQQITGKYTNEQLMNIIKNKNK